jgi:hypothetical protein
VSNAKNQTDKAQNPEAVIQTLCWLISGVHHSNEKIDLSEAIDRQMNAAKQIIIAKGIDFANEIGAPYNVSFRAEGPIATASRYETKSDVRDISGRLL